jgi:acyl-CoA reductase-like NAD-dependent aldehyde dehydrogenase
MSADDVKIKPLYIGGKRIIAKEFYSLVSPYSQEEIAKVSLATIEDVDQAIGAATHSFEIMRQMPAHRRSQILANVAKILEQRAEECAKLIALEAAKPLKTARGEIARTIQTYQFAAEEAKRIHGETIPMDAAKGGEGRMAFTIREPLGPISAITPFNFPFNLVAHKLGPAFAAGNTVVLKPAEQTPLSALMIADIFEEAGLPAGALNVVTGKGRQIGQKLVTDKRIQMVTFTGSVEVGKTIKSQVGLKRCTLELGSNSAVIIDRNIDLETAVARCIEGAFAYAGQVCISLQRIYVHQEVYSAFVEKFIERATELILGDPMDPATDVSAMIRSADADRIQTWLEEAKRGGAEIVYGGTKEGNVVVPAIVLQAAADMKISCEEAFAPVVHINSVETVEEAIDAVNESDYGLQAGIFTQDLNTAFNAIQKLEVGGVIVGDIPTFRVDHMPYGGVKESGMGREGIRYAVEEMTEMKLAVFKL